MENACLKTFSDRHFVLPVYFKGCNIADSIIWIQGSKPQTAHSCGTDSVAVLAAYKIVPFELRRSSDVGRLS